MKRKIILIAGLFLLGALGYRQAQVYERRIETYKAHLESLEKLNNELMNKEPEYIYQYKYKVVDNGYDVIFTNYYENDSTGSTQNVGAVKDGKRISTADFQVNQNGWFTYDGKVVIATATWEGIHSQYGSLKEVNDIPYGYHIYHYFDEIQIELDGVVYEAIILDTCGSSMRDLGEENQRIDIFIKGEEYAFGKKCGVAYERE